MTNQPTPTAADAPFVTRGELLDPGHVAELGGTAALWRSAAAGRIFNTTDERDAALAAYQQENPES